MTSKHDSTFVLVLREKPSIIYTGLRHKLGHPKEMNKNQFEEERTEIQDPVKIPHSIIRSNIEVEDFEIAYAEGGHIPLARLTPSLKWDWRIKVRLIKKGERRTWKNERGEGYLMNIELMDEEGS
jgi:hypothetical protein